MHVGYLRAGRLIFYASTAAATFRTKVPVIRDGEIYRGEKTIMHFSIIVDKKGAEDLGNSFVLGSLLNSHVKTPLSKGVFISTIEHVEEKLITVITIFKGSCSTLRSVLRTLAPCKLQAGVLPPCSFSSALVTTDFVRCIFTVVAS